MLSSAPLILGMLASSVLAQITLTPSTISTGRQFPTFPATTVTVTTTSTATKTESYIQRDTVTSTFTPPAVTMVRSTTVVSTVVRSTTVVSTTVRTTTATVRQVSTATVTLVSTVTRPCGQQPAACPTITSTATACRSCLVPQCTTRSVLTRPCGCTGALPTAVVSFPCNDPDSCNRIGCTTAYSIETAAC